MLIHSVYFWFKPDADPALVQRFDDGLQSLAGIPGIRSLYCGRPAATAKRPVIDDSYAWALVVTFADIAAHDHYQEHALHEQFLREFAGTWARVQVYDVAM
jgi:hypothetical protein